MKAKVPYTVILVFIGIGLTAASASFYLAGSPIFSDIRQIILALRSISNSLTANQGGASLFVGLIVPPLIFEAMMHIRSNDLRAVIRPSFLLATVGVAIATVVGGLVLWKIAGLSIYVSFLFAALISPTDVATVLEIFRRVKVPSRLAALMDTEAAFNDATAIVIFTVVLTSFQVSRPSLIQAALNFVLVFAGGVVVGLLVAFAAEILTTLISDRLTETILTISAVYGSYRARELTRRLGSDSRHGRRSLLWQPHHKDGHGVRDQRSSWDVLGVRCLRRKLHCFPLHRFPNRYPILVAEDRFDRCRASSL